MSSKIKYTLIIIVSFAVIVIVLLHNRAKIKAAENVVKLTSYPVNVDTVGYQYLTNKLNLVGTIQASNDVPIVAEAQGKVTRVLAEVGDYKTAGSTLIQLEDDLELAAFKTAQVNYQKAQKDLQRYQSLYNEKSATDAQLENAKLAYQSAEAQFIVAKKNYDNTKITTPISGIVTARSVNLGNYVNNKSVVAEVVDIANLKVMINVSEQDVFNLKTGENVQVETDVYPGVTFEGRIKTISDKGDQVHTYPVEVDLHNSKDHPLKAGMFAHVIFNSISKSKSLIIPRDALLGSVKNAQIFLVKNGVVKLKDLVLGNSSNNNLEVLSGLNPGDVVVVNGQNNLKDNYKVKVVN